MSNPIMRRDLATPDTLSSPGSEHPIGISAIAVHQPAWTLCNEWYHPSMPRKFAQHTGIQRRSISEQDEVALAEQAITGLRKSSRFQASDCAGLVVVCPSLIPRGIALRHLGKAAAREEQPMYLAQRIARNLGLHPRRVLGINSFCSGYARGMSLVLDAMRARRGLQANEFVLLVTTNRISRITDFACQQTGALFGDMATATLISRCDSPKYPVVFEIRGANYAKKPAPRPFFDFELRNQVLVPTPAGGRDHQAQRLVFSLDGMGIADIAPRAMASAAAEMAVNCGLTANEIRFVVPHQAGTGIVRFTQMKLEAAGFSAEVINGLTAETGNISSGSVPFALKQKWNELSGNILCPVAAVGAPGKSEVSQGCILLWRDEQRQAQAA